jgi:uncharacterized membrane protein SpoIIM required for sporulation
LQGDLDSLKSYLLKAHFRKLYIGLFLIILSMVLEYIVNPFRAEKYPKRMFLVGFLYCSVAIILSLWIFQQQASLVMVFLTVLAATPLFYNTIKFEEKKDTSDLEEKQLLKEHWKALSYFIYMFLGVTLAVTAWYIFLPSHFITPLFSVQTQTILDINSNAINTGATANAVNYLGAFSRIFFNNLKVLIFCILFAFIFGMGALFILTWNATVIGVAIGNFIRSNLAKVGNFGLSTLGNYFSIISIGLFKYAIHGIPEILSYFVAGLAGGIISVAVIKHDFGTRNFEKILLDCSDLLILSIILLFVSALLEVFVTPLIF